MCYKEENYLEMGEDGYINYTLSLDWERWLKNQRPENYRTEEEMREYQVMSSGTEEEKRQYWKEQYERMKIIEEMKT